MPSSEDTSQGVKQSLIVEPRGATWVYRTPRGSSALDDHRHVLSGAPAELRGTAASMAADSFVRRRRPSALERPERRSGDGAVFGRGHGAHGRHCRRPASGQLLPDGDHRDTLLNGRHGEDGPAQGVGAVGLSPARR